MIPIHAAVILVRTTLRHKLNLYRTFGRLSAPGVEVETVTSLIASVRGLM